MSVLYVYILCTRIYLKFVFIMSLYMSLLNNWLIFMTSIKGAQLADNMDGRTKYFIEVATRLTMIMSN